MFFILSKVLSFLTQPFIWVLILAIVSWRTKIAHRKRAIARITVVVFLFFSNNYIAGEAMKSWEGKHSVLTEDYYDAVIVLGGYSGWNTRHQLLELNESSDRLIQALRIYKTGISDKIILSGGSGLILKPDEKESALVSSLLKDIGVNPISIGVEDSSRNTYENAIYCKKFIQEKWHSRGGNYLLITSAFHMPRARACFEKAGFKIHPYKVDFRVDDDDYDIGTFILPSLEAFSTWNLLFREWIGYSVYWFRSYL